MEDVCKKCAIKLEKKGSDALFYCLECSNYQTNESIINHRIKLDSRG